MTESDEKTVRAGNDDWWIEAKGDIDESAIKDYVPSPESDRLRVSIPRFEGPLDLLLHLLEKHAVDVFDIPIAKITKEYLAVIDDMRALDLDVAGEFLVMASQLAHIKSKMLLPKEERKDEGKDDGEDPRAALVRRLLEYARFKDAAQRLDKLTMLGRDVFARPAQAVQFDEAIPDEPKEEDKTLGLASVDVFDLIRLLEQILKRAQKVVVHEVLVERISVGARINEVVDHLTAQGAALPERVEFWALVDLFGGRARRNVVVTFLSVLEMARLRLVQVRQDADTGDIFVLPVAKNLRPDDGGDDTLQAAIAAVEEPA